ncbi:hypothetical protein [Bradyrhizobium huanghuaihaiense]|uniref:hypothetical protein n=1 Tax=Bradyrhizobium huanghuaihaiense TaxID=990078 RepID=UPI0013150A60
MPNLLPDGLPAVQANGVGLLDLNNPLAPAAGNSQNVLRKLGQAKSCAPSHLLGVSRETVKDGVPVLVWHVVLRTKRTLLSDGITH